MPGPGDSAPKKRGATEAGSQKGGWSARAWVEIALMTLGLALLAAFCGAQIDRYLSSRAAVREFSRQRSAQVIDPAKEAPSHTGADASATHQPNLAGEPPEASGERRSGSQNALPAAVALLRIPKIHLEVPVLEGTNALTLNRGTGWIEGTARPGDRGNVGIAGHRDSFFRGLKDVKINDTISLETAHGTASYVVDQIRIVKPEDVSVLDPTSEPVLTLVTCYPFRFVGNAPKRYIVTARLVDSNHGGPETRPASISNAPDATRLSQVP
jgi:sortase A